jgi:hypothetical protein
MVHQVSYQSVCNQFLICKVRCLGKWMPFMEIWLHFMRTSQNCVKIWVSLIEELVVSIGEWIPCIIRCNLTTLVEISEDLTWMRSWIKAITTTITMIDSFFILLMILVFFYKYPLYFIFMVVWNMNLMSQIFFF